MQCFFCVSFLGCEISSKFNLSFLFPVDLFGLVAFHRVFRIKQCKLAGISLENIIMFSNDCFTPFLVHELETVTPEKEWNVTIQI